jgi:hypothetical protein
MDGGGEWCWDGGLMGRPKRFAGLLAWANWAPFRRNANSECVHGDIRIKMAYMRKRTISN